MSNPKTQLRTVEALLRSGSPVFLWGEPGVGKTAAVRRWAHVRGYKMVTLIGSLLDPTDLSGMPWREDDRTRFSPPDWLVRIVEDDGAPPSVVFLDELNCASPAVMAAMLRLVNERAVHDLHLPPQTMIVAAGNDPDQVELAADLPHSMTSRFAHLDWRGMHGREKMQQQASGWPVPPIVNPPEKDIARRTAHWRAVSAEYQEANRKHTFDYEFNKGDLAKLGRGYPTGRTWTMVEDALGVVDCLYDSDELKIDVAAAIIGRPVAGALVAFEDAMDLPDPEVWLADPSKVEPLPRDDQNMVAMSSVVQAVLQNNTAKRWSDALWVSVNLASAGRKTVATSGVMDLVRTENRPNDTVKPTDELERALETHFSDVLVANRQTDTEMRAALKEQKTSSGRY